MANLLSLPSGNSFMHLIKITSLLALILGLLTACAQSAPPESNLQVKSLAPTSASTASSPEPATQSPQVEPDYPKQQLSPDLLYGFLLGELAAQRDQKQLAADAMLELARRSNDPRVARRAAELAYGSGDIDKAIAALRLWQASEPGSLSTRQLLLGLLARSKRFAEAQQELIALLAQRPEQTAAIFLQLNNFWHASVDRQQIRQLTDAVAANYPALAEAKLATAQAAYLADDKLTAMSHIEAALQLKPDWEAALLYKVALQKESAPEMALSTLRTAVQQHPDSRDLRITLAREYSDRKLHAEAQASYAALSKDYPDEVEYAAGEGLAALQNRAYTAADTALQRALALKPRNSAAIQYYLGVVAEEQWRFSDARDRYSKVEDGDYLIQARTRLARILAKLGDAPQALALVAQLPNGNSEEQVSRVQLESQIWREMKDYDKALNVLDAGLLQMPDNGDLLYDRSLIHELKGNFTAAEHDLRSYIAQRPDSALGLNALGYTLANRTNRHAEAESLIRQALDKEPENPVIMDSLGWVLYRQGQVKESLRWLKRAYEALPDPEVAAHYGEVLWQAGEHKQAIQVWATGKQLDPRHEVLAETMQRFGQ